MGLRLPLHRHEPLIGVLAVERGELAAELGQQRRQSTRGRQRLIAALGDFRHRYTNECLAIGCWYALSAIAIVANARALIEQRLLMDISDAGMMTP